MSLDHTQVFAFLKEQFGLDQNSLDAQTLLFSGGFLDSLCLADLIAFLETHGCKVSGVDVTLENLDSVERIVNFVARSQARKDAEARYVESA